MPNDFFGVYHPSYEDDPDMTEAERARSAAGLEALRAAVPGWRFAPLGTSLIATEAGAPVRFIGTATASGFQWRVCSAAPVETTVTGVVTDCAPDFDGPPWEAPAEARAAVAARHAARIAEAQAAEDARLAEIAAVNTASARFYATPGGAWWKAQGNAWARGDMAGGLWAAWKAAGEPADWSEATARRRVEAHDAAEAARKAAQAAALIAAGEAMLTRAPAALPKGGPFVQVRVMRGHRGDLVGTVASSGKIAIFEPRIRASAEGETWICEKVRDTSAPGRRGGAIIVRPIQKATVERYLDRREGGIPVIVTREGLTTAVTYPGTLTGPKEIQAVLDREAAAWRADFERRLEAAGAWKTLADVCGTKAWPHRYPSEVGIRRQLQTGSTIQSFERVIAKPDEGGFYSAADVAMVARVFGAEVTYHADARGWFAELTGGYALRVRECSVLAPHRKAEPINVWGGYYGREKGLTWDGIQGERADSLRASSPVLWAALTAGSAVSPMAKPLEDAARALLDAARTAEIVTRAAAAWRAGDAALTLYGGGTRTVYERDRDGDMQGYAEAVPWEVVIPGLGPVPCADPGVVGRGAAVEAVIGGMIDGWAALLSQEIAPEPAAIPAEWILPAPPAEVEAVEAARAALLAAAEVARAAVRGLGADIEDALSAPTEAEIQGLRDAWRAVGWGTIYRLPENRTKLRADAVWAELAQVEERRARVSADDAARKAQAEADIAAERERRRAQAAADEVARAERQARYDAEAVKPASAASLGALAAAFGSAPKRRK